MKLHSPTVGPIVGYTTDQQSRIWFRGKFELTGESTYRRCFGVLRFRKKGTKKWSDPIYNKMSANFDMSSVIVLSDLQAETTYEYQAGWLFLDAELDDFIRIQGSIIEWPEKIYTFKAASSDNHKARSYVTGSCRYLLRTFFGDIFDDRGDKIFESILSEASKRPIHGLVMTGDQIYADDLNFFKPDERLPEFLKRYRTVFSQNHIRELMAAIPTYMILDDHEIEDNWPAKATSKDFITLYPHAIHAYQIYQCSHSPLFEVSKDNRIDGVLQKFWYTFTDGCTDWFVMDVRTERLLNSHNSQMINHEQMSALLAWLGDQSGRVKMMVTSVPFAPDLTSDSGDKWGAFPEQREQILDFIARHQVPKAVFISGDVHCSYTAEITAAQGNRLIAHQIVSSSFFWPYPHMQKSSFISQGHLRTVKTPQNYLARITSDVYSEDNFARMDISLTAVNVSFFKRKGDQLGKAISLNF